MAKKRRRRRLKKWVKAVLALPVLVLIVFAGWKLFDIYALGIVDTEYRYVYEKPLISLEHAIHYDMEGGIFYKQIDQETRSPVASQVLVVSEDGEVFHEIRTDDKGRLITGWYVGDDGRYYYTRDHGWLVTESGEIEGKYYKLAENGRVLDREWVEEGNGLCWYVNGQKAELDEDALLFIQGEQGFYYLRKDENSSRAENCTVKLADGRVLRYDEEGHIITETQRDEDGTVYFPVPESMETAEESTVIAVSEYFMENEAETLRSVNHRGYHVSAPENSLMAYMQSYAQGYTYVECDIQMTADGIPVLLHNQTINAVARNADGSSISNQVYVNNLTYEQLLTYDFGIMCGENYRGLKITRLDEFLAFCKAYGIHPYLEMKGETVDTQEEVDLLLQMVNDAGMHDNVTWISFSGAPLQYVLNRDGTARVGYLLAAQSNITSIVNTVSSLRDQGYNAFVDAVFTASDTLVPMCEQADIPLEVWTVNSEAYIRTLDPYISAITTDVLFADSILGR